MMREVMLMLMLMVNIRAATAVVITEIMPKPAENGEWLELYNESDQTVRFGSTWRLEDAIGSSMFLNGMIPAGGYLVVAQDETTVNYLGLSAHLDNVFIPSNWARLNDDSDNICLISDQDFIVDNVVYDSNASKVAGRSWERINPSTSGEDPDNWGPCADLSGHTAGKQNSLSSVMDSDATLSISPNPFNPFRGESTSIMFSLPTAVARITVNIFDSSGRKVRRLASNIPAGSQEPVLSWDGRDDNNKPLPIGRYIVFIEAIDNASGKAYPLKRTVVLADDL